MPWKKFDVFHLSVCHMPQLSCVILGFGMVEMELIQLFCINKPNVNSSQKESCGVGLINLCPYVLSDRNQMNFKSNYN